MTERQMKFCKSYLAGNTKAEAAKAAGYTQKNAAAAGSRLMRNKEVQNYIDRHKEAYTQPVAGNEEILEYLTSVLRSRDKSVTVKDKMRAAELLGKRLALFSDSAEETPCVVFYGEDKILE